MEVVEPKQEEDDEQVEQEAEGQPKVKPDLGEGGDTDFA
jgi:hypothetical protein